MTITSSDIVFLKTERMTDTEDGGGFPTSVAVVDNLSGDVFPGISEIDSMGTTKLRKLALGVITENTDTYYGAGVYVSRPPTNGDVEIILMGATSYEDEIADIKSSIEAYLVKSVITPMVLYGPHPVGLTTVMAYQRTTDPVPQPGEVYCIDDGDESHDNYFRIVTVDAENREFEDDRGVFYKTILVMSISRPLEFEFAGEEPPVRTTISPDVKIRDTVPSNAMRFYSISPMSAVSSGERDIVVDSVYSHIIPNTEQEDPIVDYLAGAERTILAATADTAFTLVSGVSGTHIYLPCAVKPGTVSVSGSGSFTDRGDGTLQGSNQTATINYDVADIVFPSSGNWTISAIPAANIIGPAHTLAIDITEQNRGYTYIRTLSPVPSPGQCSVDYRVDDKWYRIEDDGSGTLQGVGVGQINFTTGTLRVTLSAYPDIGSSIIVTWGTEVQLDIRSGTLDVSPPAIVGELADGVAFSGVEVHWLSNGVEKVATADASGEFSGDGDGNITRIPRLNESGGYDFVPTYRVIPGPFALPDPSTTYSVEWTKRSRFVQQFTNVVKAVDTYTFTIDASYLPIDADKTLIYVTIGNYLRWPLFQTSHGLITSDADGDLASAGLFLDATSNLDPDTGVVTVKFDLAGVKDYYFRGSYAENYINTILPATLSFTVTGEKVNTYSADSDELALGGLEIDLTPLDERPLASDGIILDIGSTRVYARRGTIYKNFSPTTGSGTAIGTINYSTGKINITDWTGLDTSALTVRSLAVIRESWGTEDVYGRTPLAPLRHGSFELTAVVGGTTYTAVADLNGIVKDEDEEAINGVINDDTGVFSIRFGKLVLDSSLTPEEKLEPWYDQDDVDENGYIWRPTLMDPSSIRINAVGLFYLPVDEDTVAIDPTRLPQDGRVRSLRNGDKIIMHHTDDYEFPNPPVDPGEQIQLPRGSLAIVRLFDTESKLVPTTKWSVNLSTGLVTMSNPLDLTGYPQPLTAKHTIRDSAKIVDSTITGDVNISRALTHSYPSGSYASTLLTAGNLFARVESLRAIETWIDFEHPDGDPAIGQYNDVDYPILVINEGCEDDDWALEFQSSTSFVAIGQRRGQLQTPGSTNSNFAPINSLTGLPFFTVYSAGWSSGFIAGNALRFRTRAAKFPFWNAQSIQPTTPPTTGDSFEWASFGNVL